MIGIILLCSRFALASTFTITKYHSSTEYMTATYYSESENRLVEVVKTHFEESRVCWASKQNPSMRTVRGIYRGFIKGYRQFFPYRYDHMLDVLAYVVSETNGISVDNGKEAGSCGLWISTGMAAADFYNIPSPKKYHDFRRKLLEDNEFCSYMTVASLSMLYFQTGGDIERTIAIMKMGQSGFIFKYGEEQKKPAKIQLPISRWPLLVDWYHIRRWCFCIDERVSLGTDNYCNECFPLLELKDRSKSEEVEIMVQ